MGEPRSQASRGLVVLFPEPINPKAEAVLVSNGLTMKGYTSRALERTDFDRRTLVVTMTSDQKEKLLSEFENAENVWSLPEYIDTREEVFDPYGGSLSEYGQCFEQLHFMIEVFAEKLRQEE